VLASVDLYAHANVKLAGEVVAIGWHAFRETKRPLAWVAGVFDIAIVPGSPTRRLQELVLRVRISAMSTTRFGDVDHPFR
jgi:hypothetical protein